MIFFRKIARPLTLKVSTHNIMKDTHIFFIFVVAVLLASCALMVYYKAEGFAAASGQPRIARDMLGARPVKKLPNRR